jgi:hypothetical protein
MQLERPLRLEALSDAEDARGGSLNGLAGGAGAAAGPLHPAADRPLSRPSGRSHAAPGPRQGRVASLRDRLRRPLTRARAARVGVHAAPQGGRSQAGRPRASPPQAIPQECASSSSGAEDHRKEGTTT